MGDIPALDRKHDKSTSHKPDFDSDLCSFYGLKMIEKSSRRLVGAAIAAVAAFLPPRYELSVSHEREPAEKPSSNSLACSA